MPLTVRPHATPSSLAASCLAALCTLLFAWQPTRAQSTQPNQTQQLLFAGLRSRNAQGRFNAVRSDASGNLYLLLDQQDGVRILKTDNTGSTILAQALLGAAGDSGLALALDPTGNVYVTGTTSSTTLTATAKAAIPARTGASTNSFVAKYDASLNNLFVTFTGGSRIAATALAATADAVFVTGSLFTATLPVTDDGIQQTPAAGSTQNGFVERFSSDGSTLVYATYLTGATGNTIPAAIAADTSDNAYIAGQTTASGFPTVAALVPAILSNPSGFLTRLTSAGDGITFSTFIPGEGLTSLALDLTGQTLLASGSVAPGQFPIQTVTTPIAPLTYQSLLRLPLDGSSVQSSILLAPGTQSFLTAISSGGVWIDQTLTAPLLPATTLATLGTGLALRITAQNTGPTIDQTARFGGLPNANTTYASLPTTLTAIATDPAGEPLIAGSVQPTASSSLLTTETYDLPLTAPNIALPSTLRTSELTSASCSGSLCAGSAAYLAKLNPTASAPSLVFSADDAPFLVLRNLGSASAAELQVTATGVTLTSDCPSTLAAGAECDLLLTGSASTTTGATVTAKAANATAQTIAIPAFTAPASTITFSPRELDFSIQSSASPPGGRTLTVANLGSTTQTFPSAALIAPKATTPFTELSSDCTQSGAVTNKLLAPNSTCHITFALTAPSTPASDGILQQYWTIGGRAVLLTGYSQAAALSVSASEVDFGTQFKGGLRLPRFLYLSNASTIPIAHASVALPNGSPFTITDSCPSVLAAQTVCSLRLDYLSATFPSKDSVTLALDQGLSVLVTGQSLPQPGVGGSTVNPNLSVTPTSITFANTIPVTGVSSGTQTVTVSNSGASAFSLTLLLTGDFTQQTSCPASLPGGQSCSIAISFVPSQPGIRQGLLALTAGTGFSPAYVSLSGTATAILPANNGTLDFGSSPVGQPVTVFYKIAQPFSSLTATSTGPYSVALIQDIGYGPGQPAASAYAASATASCPNCFLALRFTPTVSGPKPGTLTLSTAASGSPYTLVLTGTGLPTTGLLLTPLTPSFGTVPVNSTGPPTLFTLTNLTGAAIAVSAPALTGDFALNSTPTGGQTCPGALAATASCFLNLDFAPTATGTRTGTLTLPTSNGSVTATLTGFATPDPGLALNPNALVFNNIPGTQATSQTVTLTNTGTTPLQIATPTTTTTSFVSSTNCGTLAPGAICTITVIYRPSTALAMDTLTLEATGVSAGGVSTTSPFTVPLTGAYAVTSAGLEITPSQAIYGPAAIGAESTDRQFTLANLTAQPLTLSVAIPRQFALIGPACTSLAANSTCTFSAEFLPLTSAEITGSLLAQATPANGSAPFTTIAYLDGFGTPQAGPLTISGAVIDGVLNFGQVASGQTGTVTLTLANQNPAGSPSITVRRITSPAPFLSTSTCGQALAPGQSCAVTLHYTPTNQVATGTASPPTLSDTGLLTLESDAASSPDLINLAGLAGPIFVSNPSDAVPLAAYTLSPASLTFPSTTVGNTSTTQNSTASNTGATILHVLTNTSTIDFAIQSTCTTLLAGANCTITAASTPQTPGTHSKALEITSDSNTNLDFITLLAPATPANLTFLPTSLNFGAIPVHSSSTLPIQVTNTGAVPVVFTSITASGDYALGGNCPAPGSTLAVGQSCTVQITFTPDQAGALPGKLSFVTSASDNALTVPLNGTGNQSQLIATPTPLAFGSLALGASAQLTITLTNNGTATLTNLVVAITGEYAITRPCTVSVLDPAQSCTAQVTFTPTALGDRPGTLTVTSTDPSSPLIIPLTGTAVGGGSFSLTVNGSASASQVGVPPAPATFNLAITPSGGYSGTVALTCTALNPGLYLTCGLNPSTMTLAGAAQTSVATLNTVSAIPIAGITSGRPTALSCLMLPGFLLLWRFRKRRLSTTICGFLLLFNAMLAMQGCSSTSMPNLRLTPPGTYQYQVTATSTSGTLITQAVTLNLVIR